MSALRTAFSQTTRLLGSQRNLWVPFLVSAFVQFFLLGLVWLAPHPPFSSVLAPPVRFLLGERALHYPFHLWFLYRAISPTYLIASLLLGAFMSGLACEMVRQAHAGSRLSLREALLSRRVRYGTVLVLWLLAISAGSGLGTAVDRVLPRGGYAPWVHLVLLLLIQALCVYLIPAAVFEGSPWWKAIVQGIRETLRHPLRTAAIVVVPSLPLLVFAVLAPNARVAGWMVRFAPEIVVPLLVARVVVGTMADAVMTVASAQVWWAGRASASTLATAAQRPARAGTLVQQPSLLVAALVGGSLMMGLLNGCSADYAGERLFWKAEQANAPILKDPSGATPEQYARAINAFGVVTRRMMGTLWAARAHAAIGSLYALQEQYDRAREQYTEILQRYSQYQALCVNAHAAIAKTYERQQQWDRAITVYLAIAERYPFTTIGLEAPLYAAQLAEAHPTSTPAASLAQHAVTIYMQLRSNTKTSEQLAQVESYLALAYQRLHLWEEAAAVLQKLLEMKTGINRPRVLLTLGAIYQAKLHDPVRAAQPYRALVEQFPDDALAAVARAQLQQLEAPALAAPASTWSPAR